MNAVRCLGLIGGLGIGATIHYYEKIARAIEAEGCAPEIVVVHAETSRVFEHVQAGNRIGLAEYLNSYIHRLKAAGAEFVVIPAVTPHFCIRELSAVSSLPVVDIFKPLARELSRRNVRKAALFGTRYVVESALFGQLSGVEFIVPKPAEVDYIHSTYVELARTGKGEETQRKGLTAIAHRVLNHDSAEVIVLAGTDLSAHFNETNTDFPFVDCAALHIRSILQELLTVTSA
jgi:aspartate racemase